MYGIRSSGAQFIETHHSLRLPRDTIEKCETNHSPGELKVFPCIKLLREKLFKRLHPDRRWRPWNTCILNATSFIRT